VYDINSQVFFLVGILFIRFGYIHFPLADVVSWGVVLDYSHLAFANTVPLVSKYCNAFIYRD